MSRPFNIIIVGAGPAGLASALALAKSSSSTTSGAPASPLHVTVLEHRPAVQTLGGAVNLTPLALRYLDALGAGAPLRARAAPVCAIDLVAHRTAALLGRLWEGADQVRVQRQALVETMLEAVRAQASDFVEVVYGARIGAVEEVGEADGEGGVRVVYTTAGGEERVLEADMLLGCDGIHSQVRGLMVDPDRKKIYSGKCTAYSYASSEAATTWRRADSAPLVRDTTLLSKGGRALLLTYFAPARDRLYLSAVLPLGGVEEDGEGAREGFAARGADKAGLRRDIAAEFAHGRFESLGGLLRSCEEWFLFPVYMLPPGGVWRKGRVLLLGDAAHAMPPQGESTGVAIEDGVLLAHVVSRRGTRSVPRLLQDYEALRRADIDAIYRTTVVRWEKGLADTNWLGLVVMDWATWVVVKIMNAMQSANFGRDVRELALPE